MPKLCPNITFPHQQDFFPIRSVTKSSTARFSHENLVEKFKIFVQDFVPIRTALSAMKRYVTFFKRKIRNVVSRIQRIGCQLEKNYTVANPARGLLNRENRVHYSGRILPDNYC